jgi:hypothetical protein
MSIAPNAIQFGQSGNAKTPHLVVTITGRSPEEHAKFETGLEQRELAS